MVLGLAKKKKKLLQGDGEISLPLHPCCCRAAGCFHSSNPLCSAWWFCGVSHVALKALPWQDLWLFHSPRHRRKTQFSVFLQNSDFMQETCFNTNWNGKRIYLHLIILEIFSQ